MFNYSIVKEIKINPNPVISRLNIALTVSEKYPTHLQDLYFGRKEVKLLTTSVVAGRNTISSDVSGLAAGNYIVVLISNNERWPRQDSLSNNSFCNLFRFSLVFYGNISALFSIKQNRKGNVLFAKNTKKILHLKPRLT